MPGVEEDVSRPSQPRVASRLGAVVALEAEVGGLHHVGNPSLAEDLLLEVMAKLKTSRSRVTATKTCMVPIRVHRGTAARTSGVRGNNYMQRR